MTKIRGELLLECKAITKLIFKGYTIDKIASELKYSKSTVSNRLNLLFSKYNARNKNEFMIAVFSEIIENYKIKNIKYENEIAVLKSNNREIAEFLYELNLKLKNKNLACVVLKLSS